MEAAESVPHPLLFSPETCSHFNHVAECLLLDLLTGSCIVLTHLFLGPKLLWNSLKFHNDLQLSVSLHHLDRV